MNSLFSTHMAKTTPNPQTHYCTCALLKPKRSRVARPAFTGQGPVIDR